MSHDICRPQRATAFAAEVMMRHAVDSGEFHPVEIVPEHTFHGGIYARTITIPAGCILTGHVHKYDNMNMLERGTLRFKIGDAVAEFVGPMLVCAPGGVKRLAQAMTECVWTTFLPTTETDPAVIERLFVVKTEQEYQDYLALQMTERPGCLS